jgi:hypothetical protein
MDADAHRYQLTHEEVLDTFSLYNNWPELTFEVILMALDTHINVHYVTQVEGHGDITAKIENGKIKEIRFAVVETPRFFELFSRGRTYEHIVP